MATNHRKDTTTKIDGYQVMEEEEIAAIDYELRQIDGELEHLNDRKRILTQRKEKLRDNILLKKSMSLSNRDWNREDFPWNKNLKDKLNSVFRIKEMRELQLPTINAIMSGEDVILIMPTGGGKSLCYQLPATVSSGITIVVSPLVSLMEDQLHGLRKINVRAAMLNSNVEKAEVTKTMNSMIDPKSDLHLIYITPEYMAKSKRFMAKLQKAYQMKRLDRIAIDEVHCCSQWGHDFRPDYQFLGVMKSMFPDVPILGLTATAPSKIILDIQKMLDIQGCLALRASFNRPNLFYEVRLKPAAKEDCASMLEDLLKHRFARETGIIYTTTIKDSEELTSDLRSRGLKVGTYHAMLDAKLRSKVHAKWLSGEYQAVIATIAFGLGIDKPDVRFVIHHCISKSMENFYQESGRAGRDGHNADCIVLYRLADIFKLSGMVFKDKVGLENLYKVVAYCLDRRTCRRSLIATHFEEVWTTTDCAKMCDHCREPREKKRIDITSSCRDLYEIMTRAVQSDTRLTALKLIDAWLGKGAVNLRVPSIPVPKISREYAECVVAHLLVEGYLKEDFHFTAYSTISYLKRGPKAVLVLNNSNNKIIMEMNGALKKINSSNAAEEVDTRKSNPQSSNESGEEKKKSCSKSVSHASSQLDDIKSIGRSNTTRLKPKESTCRTDHTTHMKSSKSSEHSKSRSDNKDRHNSNVNEHTARISKDTVKKKSSSAEAVSDNTQDTTNCKQRSQVSDKRKVYVIDSSDEEDYSKRPKTS